MRTPKRGLFVRVYEDPYTEQKLEGIARLVRNIRKPIGRDETEVWTVKFVTEDNRVMGTQFQRTFNTPLCAFKTIEEAML